MLLHQQTVFSRSTSITDQEQLCQVHPLLTKCNEKSVNDLRDSNHTSAGVMCDMGSCVRVESVICNFAASDASDVKTDNLWPESFRLYLPLSWGILGLLRDIILVMSKLKSNLHFTTSRVLCHVVYVFLTKFNYTCLIRILKTELNLWEEYNMLISNSTVLFQRLTFWHFVLENYLLSKKGNF